MCNTSNALMVMMMMMMMMMQSTTDGIYLALLFMNWLNPSKLFSLDKILHHSVVFAARCTSA